MSKETIELSWADCVVIFNSLIENIERLRIQIESDDLEENDIYDAEEELNDYTTLLTRLREKYAECDSKGELSDELRKKLNTLV